MEALGNIFLHVAEVVNTLRNEAKMVSIFTKVNWVVTVLFNNSCTYVARNINLLDYLTTRVLFRWLWLKLLFLDLNCLLQFCITIQI